MSEPKTQEEFEQKVQELTERLNNELYYDKGETIKLWLEIEEYADIHNEDGWGPYYVEVSFTPKDRNDLMEIKTYILSSIFTKFYYLMNDSSLEEEFEYQCGEAYAYMREALFATNTIEEIQSYFMGRDIKKTVQQSWDGEELYVNSYLLMNPRKDVVEWALENKDALCLDEYDYKKGLQYQTVPELRALIEKEVIQ